MNLICIGKLVNTHGLNGEVKIISNFKYKNDVFKKNNCVYIDNNKYTIKSYRHHKIYEMLFLDNIDNIDSALQLKGFNVYINKDEFEFDGYLDEELIGLLVYDSGNYKGKVINILKTNSNDLLVIEGNKRHMVPNIPEFVKNIDLINKKIEIKYIKGLDNED